MAHEELLLTLKVFGDSSHFILIIPMFVSKPVTLFKSITMLCGIDTISHNIPTFDLNLGNIISLCFFMIIRIILSCKTFTLVKTLLIPRGNFLRSNQSVFHDIVHLMSYVCGPCNMFENKNSGFHNPTTTKLNMKLGQPNTIFELSNVMSTIYHSLI